MNSSALIRPLRAASVAIIIAVAVSACDDKPADSGKAPDGAPRANATSPGNPGAVAGKAQTGGPPGTEAGARELLTAFLQPEADTKALTAALRGTKADYEAVFSTDFATKLAALHEPMWQSGAAIGPKESQTAMLLHGITSAEIKAWSANAALHLPGGYEKIKDQFKDGLTVYAFKFVKPGETSGMAFDGLVHVNGAWRFFPKPFRAAQ